MKKAMKAVFYGVAWVSVIIHEIAAMTQLFSWIDEAFAPKKIEDFVDEE